MTISGFVIYFTLSVACMSCAPEGTLIGMSTGGDWNVKINLVAISPCISSIYGWHVFID